MSIFSLRGSRLLTLLLGIAAFVVGATLTLKPFSSLDALTLFVAASLILAGLGELSSGDARPRRAGLPSLLGPGLIATGLLALLLRDQTIRVIAIVVGVGLVVSGVTRIWAVLTRRADGWYVGLVGGAAAIILGVLALSWRDVTILVLALLVGPVAVILGIQQILRSFRDSSHPSSSVREGRPSRLGQVLRTAQVTLSLIVALALVGVSSFLNSGEPALAEFYTAPDDLPDAPGQLVRDEGFDRAMPEGSRAMRILYTTTMIDGSIGTASALVIVPEDAPADPLPVVLWTHGTTGVARKCAPSNLDDPLGAGAMPASQAAIDRGWAIIAPDYLGLGGDGPHPYLIGAPTAQSSLDAVRAARQIDDISLSDQTVVWGHSQGGGAALWVGVEAETYAPDVPLAGVVAMAPASNLPALAESMLENPVGLLFAAFIVQAYSDVYPDVSFDDYTRASAREVLRSMADRCLSEPATLLSIGSVMSGEELYTQPLTEGALATRLEENVPPATSTAPTLVAQGAIDDLVNPEAQGAFVDQLCAAGQVVEYHTFDGRDHLTVVADDSPLIDILLGWTADRFADAPTATACSSTSHPQDG